MNFAEFIAGMDLEEIISLRVGRLVDHVVAAYVDVPTPGHDVPPLSLPGTSPGVPLRDPAAGGPTPER